jgi:TPR repeat protein
MGKNGRGQKMAFEQYTWLCILAVISALLVIAGVKFARYMFRKEAAMGGERRRHPVVRRVLNLLPVLPVLVLLMIGVKVAIDLHNQSVAPPENIADTAFARAMQGDHAAQTELGDLYAVGKSVTKDTGEAYFWYSLAAAAGNKDAATKAAALDGELSPEQKEAQEKRLKSFSPKQKAE